MIRRIWQKLKAVFTRDKTVKRIELILDGKAYSLPFKWEQVTFEQYVKIDRILHSDLGTVERAVALVAVCTGIPAQVIEHEVAAQDMMELFMCLSFLWETKIPDALPKPFQFQEQTWQFRERIGRDKIGLLVDIEQLIKKNKGEVWNIAPDLLAKLIRPQQERKYDDAVSDDCLDRVQIVQQMPATVTVPVLLFFCRGMKPTDGETLGFMEARRRLLTRILLTLILLWRKVQRAGMTLRRLGTGFMSLWSGRNQKAQASKKS